MLEGDSQPDWLDFERKLRRANRIRQMKRAAGMVGLLLLLGFSQTFISGDWPLRSRNSGSALRVLEKAQSSESSSSEGQKPQNEEAAQELKVLHSPQLKDQLVDRDSSKQQAKKASVLAMANTSSNAASSPQLGLKPSATKKGGELQERLPPPKIEGLALASDELERRLKDLPKGQSQSGGSSKELPVPFDVPVPATTLTERYMKSREEGFFKGPNKYEPYISPLQEKRPWTYSINLYPNFAFREFKIDPTKRALLHSDFIDAMQHSESSGVNLNVGFEVSRRVGPITYFNFGLEYINNSYNAEYDFVNFRDANFDYRGEIINYTLLDDPQRIVFSDLNSFHFLNFPASISYQPWATDHLRINLEFGFSMLYFLRAQGSTIDYRTLEQIDLSDRSYRKFIASSSLKIGLQYYLNPNMNIGFEPTLMYFTNSIYTEEYPFEVIPYSMGLNVNLQMKLQ